jgi:hypothetical protein
MRRHLVKVIVILGVIGLVAVVLTQTSLIARWRMGGATADILAGAERVEVFRVDPRGRENPPALSIGEFAITATEREQGRAFAERLAGVLLKPQAHFGPGYKCFFPGVAFRLWRGGERVDVLVCFVCQNYDLITHPVGGENRRSYTHAFSSGVWDELLALAKEAFPDDADIQGLTRETRARYEEKLVKELDSAPEPAKEQP